MISTKPKPRQITLIKTSIILGITKTESHYCSIHNSEINNNKYTIARNRFDIALRNHALCAQPTDN